MWELSKCKAKTSTKLSPLILGHNCFCMLKSYIFGSVSILLIIYFYLNYIKTHSITPTSCLHLGQGSITICHYAVDSGSEQPHHCPTSWTLCIHFKQWEKVLIFLSKIALVPLLSMVVSECCLTSTLRQQGNISNVAVRELEVVCVSMT